MSTVASSNLFHVHEGSDAASKPSSPASPTHSFQAQQAVPRSFTTTIRGQVSPFPTTPTASSSPTTALEPPSGVTWREYIRTWTDSHVARWLTECKCGSHAATFKANDIRGDILLELDHPTLTEMGVTSVGDRFRILNAVKQLRQKASSKAVSRLTNHLENASSAADKAQGPNTVKRNGRPAPLTLNSTPNRGDLPRLVREQLPPDSAKTNGSTLQAVRPLPQPVQGLSSNSTGNSGSSHSTSSIPRSNLPPLPPPPRGQPPLPPPGRPPVRNFPGSGRRTPTQSDNVPAYVTQPLPPAPNPALLTPSSASNWTGYHLPADPRPGNPGGGKTPQSNSRATSPLPRVPRSTTPGHGRSGSAGLASPVTSSPNTKPPRSGAHPYATGQSVVTPASHKIDLSPIAEGFTGANPSSPPVTYSVGRGPFNPGTPSHSNAPSLDDLRRKLVKIALPDEGLTYTIDVDNCAGGVEILEKVLKKFGKGSVRNPDSEADFVHTEDGGLSVDGWGAYLDDGTGVCSMLVDESPLILRQVLWTKLHYSPTVMLHWITRRVINLLHCGESLKLVARTRQAGLQAADRLQTRCPRRPNVRLPSVFSAVLEYVIQKGRWNLRHLLHPRPVRVVALVGPAPLHPMSNARPSCAISSVSGHRVNSSQHILRNISHLRRRKFLRGRRATV